MPAEVVVAVVKLNIDEVTASEEDDDGMTADQEIERFEYRTVVEEADIGEPETAAEQLIVVDAEWNEKHVEYGLRANL